jgi:phage terminase small subunit
MSEQGTFEEALEVLPAKRRLFVLAYLDCLNKTEAASRAGYAKAGQEGHRLLKIAEIAEAVRLGFERRTMQKDEVLARLGLLATASLEDFLTLEAEPTADDSEFPEYGQPEHEGEDKARTPHPGHWRLDLAKAKRRGVMGALKKLKWGEHGPEIELHDPQPALQALGKHYRLFIDRQEVSGPNGAPLVDTEALQRAAEELAAWRQQQTDGLSSGPSAAPIVPTSATNTDN